MAVKLTVLYDRLSNSEKEYIKEQFEEYLVNPSISKQKLALALRDNTTLNTDRRGITRLMEYLGFSERDVEVVRASKKMFGSIVMKEQTEVVFENILKDIEERFSKEDIEAKYKKSSLQELSNMLGVSVYYCDLLLEHYGILKKEIKTYKEIIALLEKEGYYTENIKEDYLNKENSFADFKDIISKKIGYSISNTSTYRLLKHLNILKPMDVIAYQQGKKSRAELIANLDKLKKAGFDSREELAKFYENNHSLTKQQLVKDLNTAIDEDFFTIRWLGRHLDPFLSEDRLKGVSRAEKEFQNKVEQLLPNVAMKFNDWKTITPYQLDIYIPSLCVAIEFNGNYWHSDKFLKANHNMTAKDYHTMKKLMCQDKQIDLLYVWEYDWYEDSEAILTALEKFFKTGKNSEILSKLEY